MKLLKPNDFYSPPQFPQDCRCGCNTMWRNDIKKQQKQEMNNHTVVPTLLRVGPSETFPLSQRWQQVSNCPSGPKHFTIFSKNCWTVENHLIRMTHFFLSRFVGYWSHCSKKKKKKSSYSQNLKISGSLDDSKSTQKHTIRLRLSLSFYLKCSSFSSCRVSWRYPCQDCVTEQVTVPLYTVWGLGSYKPLIQRRMRPVLVGPDELGSSSKEQDGAATLHTHRRQNTANCRLTNHMNKRKSALWVYDYEGFIL